jgi:hypothetical protein
MTGVLVLTALGLGALVAGTVAAVLILAAHLSREDDP